MQLIKQHNLKTDRYILIDDGVLGVGVLAILLNETELYPNILLIYNILLKASMKTECFFVNGFIMFYSRTL